MRPKMTPVVLVCCVLAASCRGAPSGHETGDTAGGECACWTEDSAADAMGTTIAETGALRIELRLEPIDHGLDVTSDELLWAVLSRGELVSGFEVVGERTVEDADEECLEARPWDNRGCFRSARFKSVLDLPLSSHISALAGAIPVFEPEQFCVPQDDLVCDCIGAWRIIVDQWSVPFAVSCNEQPCCGNDSRLDVFHSSVDALIAEVDKISVSPEYNRHPRGTAMNE